MLDKFLMLTRKDKETLEDFLERMRLVSIPGRIPSNIVKTKLIQNIMDNT